MPPNNETGFNLPPPLTGEQAYSAPTEQASTTPEQGAATPEQLLQPAVASPVPVPPIPMPQTQTVAQPAAQQTTSVSTNGATQAVADDGDLIEKEWVNKAKQIVERTRDNPYQQSEELTVFKADYMKKHYNKTIKTK